MTGRIRDGVWTGLHVPGCCEHSADPVVSALLLTEFSLLSACFLIAGLVNCLIYGSVHQFWPSGITCFSFQAGK